VRLDERLRFSTLVVGSANRLAVAAARAVAEAPGRVYNPLFVYGASGLGKTHLLGGIAEMAVRVQPALVVEYVTVMDFVEQFHAAIAAGEAPAWAARWQRVDLLLIDDIQFLTGRRETQSELLRLFTAMQANEKQIVLTSDRPPSEISDVDERLIAQLQGGLVVDVGHPEFETRAAILRGIAAHRQLDVPGELLDELARYEFTNVRELQGALNRLAAQRALGTDEVSVAEIARALGVALPGQGPRASDDFASFLTDVASAVQLHVDGWRTRLGESIAYWAGEGYRTAVLERAMLLTTAPDVDGLIATFSQAIEHLRALEAQATTVDPALGGNVVFRDPEQLAAAEDLVERALAGLLPPPGPSPAFARSSFEISGSNQLAARAADAVAAEPGTRYNPLLLHGPSGVGKTHLAHAIGNEILARHNGRLTVACVPTQQLVDELIAAIGAGSVDRWRTRYRAADVLILDDVQFLAGKERTQEEIFHIFNSLQSAGKQVILTSDEPPHRIPDLEERVRSRFEGGLVVPIDAPDRVLRERLAARLLAHHERTADAELVQFIAEQSAQNVRELQGIVHRLVAAADVAGVSLTAAFAQRELGAPARQSVAAPALRAADATFLDKEKVVWDWPDVSARIIEELR
jgi:chromosomal replication initiation ATPase DnaA